MTISEMYKMRFRSEAVIPDKKYGRETPHSANPIQSPHI